jgi:predicted secreted acid phosphatase
MVTRRTRGIEKIVLSACLWTLLGAQSCYPASAKEPQNLATFEKQLITYHDSGQYEDDLRKVADRVIAYLRMRAPGVKKAAIVLDIDETALSNWPELIANQFAFFPIGPCHIPQGPCGNDSWEQSSALRAIRPTHDIYLAARASGVTVFFVTGRRDVLRAATIKNLKAAGYRTFAALIMEPNTGHFASAADFKSEQRRAIEQRGFTIIANVGDQRSDLAGGHEERAFKLPNPFYRIP